ncbi:hypothetical protein CDAR_304511 [Caerostris darwini]|uniref:Uncharacterized protein n=1 Tax=Caerostris darwini TaxID=1538125 RepID=A0AAV4NMD7_9ARAC|nr:hypothetical protein CDAR_304511 [Caerostris darwini]
MQLVCVLDVSSPLLLEEIHVSLCCSRIPSLLSFVGGKVSKSQPSLHPHTPSLAVFYPLCISKKSKRKDLIAAFPRSGLVFPRVILLCV